MRMLAIRDVLAYLAVSRTKLHTLRKEHGFPEPALVVGKMQRWDIKDVDAWLEMQRQRTAQG